MVAKRGVSQIVLARKSIYGAKDLNTKRNGRMFPKE